MPSLGRWKSLSKSRSGRRPISVAKLLAREAEGKLFRKHGHELMGETEFQGLDIAIENDVGSTRKGKNADGTEWSVTYDTPYGYIRGTTGADDEEVDCYVGPNRDADTAYVVHQKNDAGGYDEDTIMLGYDSEAAAKADILRHYSDPKYVGDISPISMEELHALLGSGEKLVEIGKGRIKAAGSRLREAFKVVPGVTEAGRTNYRAMLGDEPIGWMDVVKGKVTGTEIDEQFRGMGLGKKLYGEVMRRQPNQTLSSDTKVSPAAQRVWESMKKDPSYTVKEPVGIELEKKLMNPHMPLVDRVLKRFPKFQEARQIFDRALIRSPYSASLPAEAAIKSAAQATHDHDYADNDFGDTGAPAPLRRYRLELPFRDEVEVNPTPKVEQRQDSQGAIILGGLATPGGFEDTGKTAMRDGLISHAMDTLGELSRKWEVPSDDEVRGAQTVDHHGPFGITMSDIGAQQGDQWEGTGQGSEQATRSTKTASMFEAFVQRLGTLNAVTPEQLQKVAEVTREQAQSAMARLDELEHQRPTLGQLGRGAAVGSIVGPIASNVNKLISKGEFNTPREIAGQIAGGAIFGIATPIIKHKVETGTERHALREYVNQGHGGRLATQIENKLET